MITSISGSFARLTRVSFRAFQKYLASEGLRATIEDLHYSFLGGAPMCEIIHIPVGTSPIGSENTDLYWVFNFDLSSKFIPWNSRYNYRIGGSGIYYIKNIILTKDNSITEQLATGSVPKGCHYSSYMGMNFDPTARLDSAGGTNVAYGVSHISIKSTMIYPKVYGSGTDITGI